MSEQRAMKFIGRLDLNGESYPFYYADHRFAQPGIYCWDPVKRENIWIGRMPIQLTILR